jgi:hypothetical protein
VYFANGHTDRILVPYTKNLHRFASSFLPQTRTTLFRAFSWRYGLHIVSGIASLTILFGLFYRSATLYHPQRRAILHLKSLKRKFTHRNGQWEKERYGQKTNIIEEI